MSDIKDPKTPVLANGFAVKTSKDGAMTIFPEKGEAESYCHTKNLDVKSIVAVKYNYFQDMTYTGVRG